MTKALERIEVTTVADYTARINVIDQGENWKAVLSLNETPAYLKLTSEMRHIIAELTAAQLGRALGMPIPKPFLVVVHNNELPKSSRFYGSGLTMAFASQQYGKNPMSCEQLYQKNNHEFEAVLNSWTGLNGAIAFDEYIANDDRHSGNIIYSPEENEIGLIDHARSLTGVHWPLWGLSNPAIAVSNQLIDGITIDSKESAQLRKVCNELMSKCQLIDFTTLDQDEHFQRLGGVTARQEIVEFLTQRVHFTVSLLCQRIGLPEFPAMTH